MSEIYFFKWRTFIVIAFSAIVFASALYKIAVEPSVFFTTHSPSGLYTIHLSGQKERPAFFTVEVGFDVLKKGKPFWTGQSLHLGDSLDTSFEEGWPNHRWIGENVIQFYHEADLREFTNNQEILLANKTSSVIRNLRLSCSDKFLVLDLQPGTEIRLSVPPPKGDLSGIYVEGEFYDGNSFKGNAIFDVEKINTALKYAVHVTDEAVKFESDLPRK
ncbi:MAG: hypothetical protein WKF92_05120 [Pyrinomonadaceae bacterium]